MRTCVIVSPYFPPSTLAGVHRARHLAKHLPAAGWKPIVLCVDEDQQEERLDPALAKLVPSSVEVVKVGAFPAGATRRLGFGDLSLRAWGHLRKGLFDILDARPVDVVLITGAPYYPMLLGRAVKRRHNVPVVVDFQDPWVCAWGARQRKLSKAGLSHLLATLFEARVLRHADFVTSVSEVQNAEMSARYPWLDKMRMAGIPIGGDPDDFTALRYDPGNSTQAMLESGFINLCYVGTIWPPVIATVRTLLRAAARLRAAHPALYRRLKFNFIGTNAAPRGMPIDQVRPIAEEEGVADAVQEIPQRLPYLDALTCLARADGILMVGSDEPHYTASKIYPGLMSGRPFLSLFHKASSAHSILSSAGGGLSYAFATRDDLRLLEAPLSDALYKLATTPESLGRAAPASYAPYEARAIARQFANIFDELVG